MIRVAIADDLEMIRTGFELIIDNETDMTIVASVGDGRQIVEACRTRDIDVVLMDVRMPELDGLAASEQILTLPSAPAIIILTTFGLDDYVVRAVAAGCSGFLLKDANAETLVSAIRSVHAGDAVLAPSVIRSVLDGVRGLGLARKVDGIDDLTARELEVLRALATGLSNAEIASKLFLSEATVKTHITHILSKLAVRDRVQAVIAAFESGVARGGESNP